MNLKKYKVTRTWYIESKDVLLRANERNSDEVNVQCLENQFTGDNGFGGHDPESTYKVTRIWHINAGHPKEAVRMTYERDSDDFEVERLEGDKDLGNNGLKGFLQEGGEGLSQALLQLLERAREQRTKKYPYIVHESLFNESTIRHFYRESDLINDLISILTEIK